MMDLMADGPLFVCAVPPRRRRSTVGSACLHPTRVRALPQTTSGQSVPPAWRAEVCPLPSSPHPWYFGHCPGSALPRDTEIQLYRRTAIGTSGAWELAVGTRRRTETRSPVTERVITERRVVSRYSGTFRRVKGDVDTRDVLASALLRSSTGSPASRGQAGLLIDSHCSSGRSRFSARDCSRVGHFSPSILLCGDGGDLFVEYQRGQRPSQA